MYQRVAHYRVGSLAGIFSVAPPGGIFTIRLA